MHSSTRLRLGLVALLAVTAGAPSFASSSGAPARPTTVTADSLELVGTEDRSFFTYVGAVRVEGTNLVVLADRMEMVALRRPETGGGGAVGEIGGLESIVAEGNVVITQEGRVARAGKAEVLPREGKLVLTGNPSVEVRGAVVTGWRITLVQGEKRAYVEANPLDRNQRPTVTADALPDLGFDASEPPPSAAPSAPAGGTP